MFDEKIMLNEYAEKSSDVFNNTLNSIEELDKHILYRLNGKTTNKITCALFFNIVWLALFVVFAIVCTERVNLTLLLVTLISNCSLLIIMVIENITGYSYYKKIAEYHDTMLELQQKADYAKEALNKNTMLLQLNKENGWNFNLDAAPSINEMVTDIAEAVAGTESLRWNLVQKIKSVPYFVGVVSVSISIIISLHSTGLSIINRFLEGGISNTFFNILNIIFTVLIVFFVILAAWMIYEQADFGITNASLLAIIVAPILYLIFITLISIILRHFILALIALAILGVWVYNNM